MAWHLITSLLSLCSNLLPSIRASAQASSSSSSSSSNNSEKERLAIEEDLERLMRTLERIKATLYDAEQREIIDHSVKLWLKELKRVAYAAEDVLSEYQYEVTRVQVEARKASEACGSYPREHMECVVPIPHGMVDRLNKVRNQFDEIAMDREALQLREIDGARRQNYRVLRLPTSHMVDEASIFGRGTETKDVINFLLSDKDNPFSVISIIGKGGLGKTTIAQLVYKDVEVHKFFNFFGWVCVSQEFDVRRFIMATIESVSKMNCAASELSTLQIELANLVKGKKMLLVLDDVWNENQSLWELFKVPFKEAELVRILVTTRNDKVAEVMQTMTSFKPNYLPENYCWQLFKHYAFGSTSYTMPTHLEMMGREIIRKCGGLPLAVKSIASLLRHEEDENSWREILKSDLWESNPSNDIFPALQISYSHLPAHLKPCFLFCSMYPKDYILQKMNLVQLWISHGYIKRNNKRSLTQVGVEYYEELKERSFLDNFSDESEFCKLHDIIHDLARLNSDREHYSVDINDLNDITKENIPQEAYHLYAAGFTGFVNQIPQQIVKGLRTLSTDLRGCKGAFEHQYCINDAHAMDLNLKLSNDYEHCWGDTSIFNFTKFEALRILELKGHCLRMIPHNIAQLKHLSHLCITSNNLEKLPVAIGFLYNLQTFILDCWRSPLEYLPDKICDLVNLRCLHIECCNLKKLPKHFFLLTNLLRLVMNSTKLESLPSGIRKLSNLQELTLCSKKNEAFLNRKGNYCQLIKLKTGGQSINYNPRSLKNFPAMRNMAASLRSRSIAWLKDMNDLEGQLTIEGIKNIDNLLDAQHANLRSKCKIRSLDLCWFHDHKYEDRHMQGIEELKIRLQSKEPDKGKIVCQDINFDLLECLQPHPHLKCLVLEGYPCATVPNWMEHPFSLQAIKEITLQSCDGLQSLPFRKLCTLKYLQLVNCSGIRILQVEQLPSQLEELGILWCKGLNSITGLQNLKMLATLNITFCEALKSITMDKLQLIEPTGPFSNSSNEIERHNQHNTSTLTSLHIVDCPLLCALPCELIPSEPCYVFVHDCGCPDLEIGNSFVW